MINIVEFILHKLQLLNNHAVDIHYPKATLNTVL